MIHFFSGRIPWKNIDAHTIAIALEKNPTDIYKNFDKTHLAYPIIQNCCREGEDDRPSSKELLDELKVFYEKL